MLKVTGVGEFKYTKYGERFLACVKKETQTEAGAVTGSEAGAATGLEAGAAAGTAAAVPDYSGYDDSDDLYFFSEEEDLPDYSLEAALTAWENGSPEKADLPADSLPEKASSAEGKGTKKRSSKTKSEFVMTEELADQIHYSDRVTLSDFVGQINDLRDDEAMKRLTIKSVEQKLMEEKCWEIQFFNGMGRKKLTEEGGNFGIEAEKRLSEKGNEYEVLYYTEKAQRGIVTWLLAGDQNLS